MSQAYAEVSYWLHGDDTGISSKSLACEFLGMPNTWVLAPADPADLGRCLRLIALAPEVRACVDSLANRHECWRRAAAVWDAIAASMAEEVGIDWSRGQSAPKTYELMKQAGL